MTGRHGVLRRLWDAPLRAHAGALAVILLLVLLAAGPERFLSADEGAAAAQAHELAEGRGWTMAHPLPQVDETGEWFAIGLSTQREGSLEFAPFAKHPVYPTVLASLMKVGGVPLAATLSVVGTVLAAVGAALLSRQLRPGIERASLWATALASPLFYFSFVMIAHTLGAAIAVWLVVVALRSSERARLTALAGVATLAAVGGLLRNEFVLFGIAVGLAFGVDALARRRRSSLFVAGAALAGTVFGYALDAVLEARALGGSSVSPFTIDSSSVLADRWHAFKVTVLLPADAGALTELCVLLTVLLFVASAVMARREPVDRRLVAILAAGSAACALVWLSQDAVTVVAGFVFAFPLLLVGLVSLPLEQYRWASTRLLLGIAGVFSAAVCATQYRNGGGGWGGRYFVLVVPVVVPLAVLGVRHLLTSLDAATGRVVRVAGVVVVAVYLLAAASAVGFQHRRDAAIDSTLRAVTTGVDAGDGDARPVVVTTNRGIGRFSWRLVADQRWLYTEVDDLPRVVERLREAGIERFVLVDDRAEATASLVEAHYRPAAEVQHASVDWLTVPEHLITPGAVVMEAR